MLVRLVSLLVVFIPSRCFLTPADVVFTSLTPVFKSGVGFVGEYVGSASGAITWSVPDYCTSVPVSDKIQKFLCRRSGSVAVTLTVGADSLVTTLTLELSSSCYAWSGQYTSERVEVWVDDEEGGDDTGLSFEFYALGERPSVELHCDKSAQIITGGVFNLTSNRWELSLRGLVTTYCTWYSVKGIPVSLNGCTVGETNHPALSAIKFSPTAGPSPTTSSTYKLCTDHCGSGMVALLDQSGVAVSTDSLLTHQTLPLNYAVKDCGMILGGNLVLLSDDGNKLITVTQDGKSVKEIQTSFQTDEITVNNLCMQYVENNYDASPYVLSSGTGVAIYSNTHELLASYFDPLPGEMTAVQSVSVSYFGVSVILTDGAKTKWLQFDSKTSTLAKGVEMGIDCTGGCDLHGICPHSNLLVKSNSLYFVSAGGHALSKVRDQLTGEAVITAVLSVAIGPANQWAVLSTDKKIYYGFCSRASLVEIGQGFTSAKEIMIDNLSALYTITASGSRVLVPVEILLKRALGTDTCHLRDFGTTISNSLVCLDKGEVLYFDVTMLSRSFYQPSILYQFYPQANTDVNITSKAAALTSLYGSTNTSQVVSMAGKEKGMSVVVTSPEMAQPPCSPPISDVTYVSVGCPKWRSLEILNKPDKCDSLTGQDLTYTIPAYLTSDRVEKTVSYNLAQLGCPIIWSYDQKFLPNVWIYDAGVPARQLTSNFVVREVNSRTDFNYTLTTAGAGCSQKPQSRQQMGDTWGPDNYVDCNKEVGSITKIEGKRPYEILKIISSGSSSSVSGLNYLTWSHRQANYTFELVVLDASTSYCTLTTKFAVWIVDAPSSSDLGIIVLFVSCCAMLVILGLSYIQYRRIILSKANLVLQS